MKEHRLLVVDDDTAVCDLIRDVGETCAYTVATPNTVPEFQKLYSEFSPTVVMLDLSIGEADGIELLRYLSKRGYDFPVLLMSGHDEKVRRTAFRLGSEYGLNMMAELEKPIDVAKLSELLMKLRNKASYVNKENLKRAIEEFELELYYQPLIAFKTQALIGIEALVRWQPKDHPQLLPDAFIPLAEELGLVLPLTEWVVEKAFEQLAIWKKQNHHLGMQINLSSQLLNNLSLPDQIAACAKKYEISPQNVCFEITESGAMNKPQMATDILIRLRVKGFSLALDDFGTGYSSLIELYRLPFREIKIDRSFVLNVVHDHECSSIIHSIIQLAHSLKLKAVAEGIETKEAWDTLNAMGCDIGQGYYMGHPMSAENFIQWMQENTDKERKFIHKV